MRRNQYQIRSSGLLKKERERKKEERGVRQTYEYGLTFPPSLAYGLGLLSMRLTGWTWTVKSIRTRSVPSISTASRIAQTSKGIQNKTPILSGVPHFLSTNSPPITSTQQQQARTMATATKIQVSTDAPGIFNVGVRSDSAEKASKVLQENLRKFHIYFNNQGFHSKSCKTRV